jgi:presenilin-like A22 family membrane protease
MFKVWRIWFLLAVGATLGISLSVFIDWTAAFIIGFALGYLKIFKPNVFVHNFTEIFMYSGIAVLLVPIFDVLRMIVALFAISLYDAYAVWQSKHMIKMAEFQSSSKLFAGLHIPYEKPKKATKVKIKIDLPQSISQDGEARSAILGGGDIAFPLLFAGSVMIELIKSGLSKEIAFFQTLPIPLFAGIALFLLFVKSQKGKFYPAMPFITAGCLIGYGIVLLL